MASTHHFFGYRSLTETDTSSSSAPLSHWFLHQPAAMSKTNPGDVLFGAAAGVIATIPMTVTMEELHGIMPGEHDGALPPREVTEGVYEQLGARHEASEQQMERSTVLLHYAFGGAAGALFPLVAPRKLAPAIGAGVLYGLCVWSGSYLGFLPALGVRHNARHDPAGRNGIMIAAHVVWGATLGMLLRSRPGLRVASRHPDAPRSGTSDGNADA